MTLDAFTNDDEELAALALDAPDPWLLEPEAEDDVVEVGDPPTGMVVTAPEITVWQSGSMLGPMLLDDDGLLALGNCRAGRR